MGKVLNIERRTNFKRVNTLLLPPSTPPTPHKKKKKTRLGSINSCQKYNRRGKLMLLNL